MFPRVSETGVIQLGKGMVSESLVFTPMSPSVADSLNLMTQHTFRYLKVKYYAFRLQ